MTTLNQAVDELVPEGMHVIHEIDGSGDTRHIWDPENPDEVAAAKALYDKLVGEKRYRAYSVMPNGDKSAGVREFDPAAEKLIFSPPLQGG
jgi:hypothetical protein